MLYVQESLGQVVIPYGISIGNTIWETVNTLGLIFIPFAAIYLVAFFTSRAQGQDEGSPAVLAIKIIEKGFYSSCAVLFLFMIPTTNGIEVSYNHYLCGAGIESSQPYQALQHSAMTDVTYSQVVTKTPYLPLGWGIVNNLAVGSSEALSGAMNVCTSATAVQAKLDEAYIKVDDKNLEYNLNIFNEQCFTKAQDAWATAEAKGETYTTEGTEYERRRLRFFDTYMKKMYTVHNYSMSIKSAMFSDQSGIDNSWKPKAYGSNYSSNYSVNTDLNIPCYEASDSYKQQLSDYIKNDAKLTAALARITTASTVFPQEENGKEVSTSITAAEMEGDYIHQAFLDVIMGKRALFETTPKLAAVENQSWAAKTWDYVSSLWTALWDSPGTAAKEVLVYAGASLEIFPNAAGIINLYIVAPLYVSIITAVLYAATPLIVLMSGYSWKFVYNIILTHVYLAMIPYVLNISYAIVNIILIYADSYYGSLQKIGGLESVLYVYTASCVPIMCLTGWTMISAIYGLNLGSFISAIIAQNGVAAGRQGFEKAKQGLSLAMAGMGKGFKAAKAAYSAKSGNG